MKRSLRRTLLLHKFFSSKIQVANPQELEIKKGNYMLPFLLKPKQVFINLHLFPVLVFVPLPI